MPTLLRQAARRLDLVTNLTIHYVPHVAIAFGLWMLALSGYLAVISASPSMASLASLAEMVTSSGMFFFVAALAITVAGTIYHNTRACPACCRLAPHPGPGGVRAGTAFGLDLWHWWTGRYDSKPWRGAAWAAVLIGALIAEIWIGHLANVIYWTAFASYLYGVVVHRRHSTWCHTCTEDNAAINADLTPIGGVVGGFFTDHPGCLARITCRIPDCHGMSWPASRPDKAIWWLRLHTKLCHHRVGTHDMRLHYTLACLSHEDHEDDPHYDWIDQAWRHTLNTSGDTHVEACIVSCTTGECAEAARFPAEAVPDAIAWGKRHAVDTHLAEIGQATVKVDFDRN